MKNVLKFVALTGWPFVLLLGVYIWYNSNAEEREAKKRHEILSDTTAVNRAYRTYERIHHEQLMEDPEYRDLYEEVQILRDSLRKIKEREADR